VKLKDRIALVTGSGRGIGKGCALELAREGADLILNDRPGSPDLEFTASEIRKLGRQCTTVETDVFSRAGCQNLVKKALDATGRIDLLVSNPAYNRRQPFLEYDPEDFELGVRSTLISGFHISQLVARQMVEQKIRGKIVFISSVHAAMPQAGSAAYNAAKAGLNHLARTIALELIPHRINVNIIEPGWTDTPGEVESFGRKAMDQYARDMPWGRLGSHEDIGRVAAFLCSPDADYMTGSVVRVDGGFTLKN
jgi:glucose 1-dehydrogenase